MTEAPRPDISPEEVEARLRELEQLCELGMALREARLTDPQVPQRVRERPDVDARGQGWPDAEREGS